MPDRIDPVPDEVLREIAGATIHWRHGAELPGLSGVSAADLAREVLELREVLRENMRVASMSGADFVAYVADTVGTGQSLLARTRALLPEHKAPPA